MKSATAMPNEMKNTKVNMIQGIGEIATGGGGENLWEFQHAAGKIAAQEKF
jgi:hypothetical protein